MPAIAGNMLWSRRSVTIPAAENGSGPGTVDFDTGLQQVSLAFLAGQPTFEDPSRVMVLPMAPLSQWIDVTHGEPFLDADTGTIHVEFSNSGVSEKVLNVLFWNPHTNAGPGAADLYNPE